MKGASPFERKKHGKVIVCSSYLPPGTFLEPWGTEDHGWCCGQQTLRRGGISVKITLAEEYARWWVFKKTKRKKKKNQNRFSFLLHLSSFLLFFHLSKRPGALVFLVWMELLRGGGTTELKFSLALWLIWSCLKSQVSMCFCFYVFAFWLFR